MPAKYIEKLFGKKEKTISRNIIDNSPLSSSECVRQADIDNGIVCISVSDTAMDSLAAGNHKISVSFLMGSVEWTREADFIVQYGDEYTYAPDADSTGQVWNSDLTDGLRFSVNAPHTFMFSLSNPRRARATAEQDYGWRSCSSRLEGRTSA